MYILIYNDKTALRIYRYYNIYLIFCQRKYAYCNFPEKRKTANKQIKRNTRRVIISVDWCQRHTRLVVETELAGRTCYYTMTMPAIESNHIYTVKELRITRPGSSDPELPVLPGDASFTIEVEDWEDGYSGSFEI